MTKIVLNILTSVHEVRKVCRNGWESKAVLKDVENTSSERRILDIDKCAIDAREVYAVSHSKENLESKHSQVYALFSLHFNSGPVVKFWVIGKNRSTNVYKKLLEHVGNPSTQRFCKINQDEHKRAIIRTNRRLIVVSYDINNADLE